MEKRYLTSIHKTIGISFLGWFLFVAVFSSWCIHRKRIPRERSTRNIEIKDTKKRRRRRRRRKHQKKDLINARPASKHSPTVSTQ